MINKSITFEWLYFICSWKKNTDDDKRKILNIGSNNRSIQQHLTIAFNAKVFFL